MSADDNHNGKVWSDSLGASYEAEAGSNILNSPSIHRCLLCPLNKVPRCFRAVLTRSLELGEGNFIPTNWRGFSDYFRLHELKARSAEELIEAWADRHPYRRDHSLQKVVEYARSTRHAKLLQQLEQTLKDHLRPTEEWTNDPVECFKTCSFCVPLQRSDSKSSDDIHSFGADTSHSQAGLDYHTLRRTHSLPKDIQIAPPTCQSHCSGTCTPCPHRSSSITNIYMSCSCRQSLLTPSSMSPSSPTHHYCKPPVRAPPQTPPTTPSAVQSLTGESGCCIRAGDTNHVRDSTRESVVMGAVSASQDQRSLSSEEPHPLTQTRRRRIVSESQVDKNRGLLTAKTNLLNRGLCDKQRTSLSDCHILFCREANAIDHSIDIPHVHNIVEGEKEERSQGKDGMESVKVVKEKQESEPVDVLCKFGHQLFDSEPYNIVQRLYNSNSREVIILVLACFFLYNGFRCILQTMCEDGGFRTVFTNRDKVLGESARRIAMFSLRMLCVVITPLCLCLHISPIASKPRIPRTSFSEEEAIERMICVHRNFSPHYEVKLVQNTPKSVFQVSDNMTKRHINSIWISFLNSLLFPGLLCYIGGVRLTTKNFTEGGVCQFVTVSVIRVPLLDDDVHLLMILDLLLALGVMVCVQTLKDYYYYENRIAVFAVTVGREAEKLYSEIRRRWVFLDYYCYLTAIAILIGSFAMAYLKKTIIPDPSVMLAPEHLLNWVFWISVLSVVSCLGNSSNRLIKKTSLPAYVLVVILINIVNLHINTIPVETMIVFFMVTASVLVSCLLVSLCQCHYYHYQHTHNPTSLFFLFLSLSLIILLPLSVILTLYREVVHLSAFVQW